MNLIKELSTDYPDAWKAFMEWCKHHSETDWNSGETLSKAELRYLLADLQAFLRSAGTHITAEIEYGGTPMAIYYPFVFDTNSGENFDWYVHDNEHETALTAAVKKGMEILQNQIKTTI